MQEAKSIIEIFTSPGCPHCPNAVKVVKEIEGEREDFIFREFNTFYPEGKERAKQFEVSSVPTIFVRGPGHDEILAITGTPSKGKLNELIDLSQGKKSLEEVSKEKGFFESLFGKKIKLE
jgi:glutaredoxin